MTDFRIGGAAVCLLVMAASANAEPGNRMNPDKARVIEHWTADRINAAIPRDMVIDERGLGYIRGKGGALHPHGHSIQALNSPGSKTPAAKPGSGGNDSTPPAIDETSMNPSSGDTIGASHTFSANVTDNVGVRSVTFVIRYPAGNEQSFSATNSGGDTWSASLSGFTDGNWSWRVEARDTAKGRGNSSETGQVAFTVDTGGGGDGGDGGSGDGSTVANARWSNGGVVQEAAGRLFYEMPSNSRRKRWVGYVCSGTVVTDGIGNVSVILTAAALRI